MNLPRRRFESKYILDPCRYHGMKAFLARHFRLDPHAQSAPGRRYMVRSLYFDTSDYQAYFDKVTGDNRRFKIRFRVYGTQIEEATFVKVELKRRIGKHIEKSSTRSTLDDCTRFIETGVWPDEAASGLHIIDAYVKQMALRPKVLVDYRREAYSCRHDASIRLSFDHDIRYAEARSLFPDRPSFRADFGKPIVMEIKVPQDDIEIVSRLVRDFDLKAVPNSKYANAIDHTQTAIWL